jgi:hypothetical protein
MKIEKELSNTISKSNAIKVASLIGCDGALFKQLVKILLEILLPFSIWYPCCL